MSTPSLQALNRVSTQLGRDLLLIQAAGGNTSLKDGDTLWVKASGKWLMQADAEALFVPVSLAGVRRRVQADEADPVGPEVLADRSPPGLRPSIETTLHALMPQPAVLHAHSVAAIAWAVREDGRERIAERLGGLRWAWVSYVRPGLPLTRAVARELDAAPAGVEVLVFGNHGIVTGGDNPEAALALMHQVGERLEVPPRDAATGRLTELQQLATATRFRLPADAASHALGTDAEATRRAAGGAMYPDHVVFLGAGLAVIDPARGALAAQLQALGEVPALIVAGAGVLVHESLGAAGEAMLRCLADVCLRIDPAAQVRYLPDDEVEGLQQWDAEKFRKQQQ